VIQPSLVEVNGLVLDTIKMLRRVIGEDIDLVTELAPETTLVHVDPGQLEQILMNLAVNARDAMPKGGRLSIETANVTLDQSHAIQPFVVRPGPYVMLGVSDTGIGMDAQTRERVFEPFFTTKERGRGTGLGLATVYGIVKQSGGHIVLDSEPGLGAAFSVYLPRAENVDFATPPTIDAAQAPTGSETILLVEDEQAVRFLSRVLLERAGYSVLDAGDPQHAALVFQQYGPAIDLLVTDVIMPGSSGPTLFKHLSAERPDLKVLYISGYTDDVFGRQAGLASDVVFLEKPFTADRLMFKVREALDR